MPLRPRTPALLALLIAGQLLAPAARAGARQPVTPPPAATASERAGDPRGGGDAAVEPLRIAPPSKAAGATVARIVAPTFARARLDTPRRGRRLATATAWSGQAQILLVLDAATHDGRQWVKLLLT